MHRAQLPGHHVGRRRPLVGALGQGPANHPVHGRDGRRAGERRRLLVARRVQDLDHRTAGECRTTGEHLEENGASREQIDARVDGLAYHLFGGHVAGRAHQDARARQAGDLIERATELRPGEAEVEQLHAVNRQEHIGRFQVTVDDPASVQG